MNKKLLSFSAYLILFLSHFSIVAETSPAMEMEVENPSKSLKRSASDTLDEVVPSKKANLRSSLTMRRLSTQQDHSNFLKESISTAQHDILITSYGVDNAGLEIGEIYSLLAAARDRGVKVTIYNDNDKKKSINAQTSIFFSKHEISYHPIRTHAKILAVDNQKLAIGSYNWLRGLNDWENASICLSGNDCKELTSMVCNDLNYSRLRKFGINSQFFKSNICYFQSLSSHRQFISDSFKVVKNKIIFCSPFIKQYSGYEEDFNQKTLQDMISRRVSVYFACKENSEDLNHFKNYLGDLLNSKFINIITLPNFHLKTALIDDDIIAEGSFNWLSHWRKNIQSTVHNFEATLVIKGADSIQLIQDFYATSVGQKIIEYIDLENFKAQKRRQYARLHSEWHLDGAIEEILELARQREQKEDRLVSLATEHDLEETRRYQELAIEEMLEDSRQQEQEEERLISLAIEENLEEKQRQQETDRLIELFIEHELDEKKQQLVIEEILEESRQQVQEEERLISLAIEEDLEEKIRQKKTDRLIELSIEHDLEEKKLRDLWEEEKCTAMLVEQENLINLKNKWLTIENWIPCKNGNYMMITNSNPITLYHTSGSWNYARSSKFFGSFSNIDKALESVYMRYENEILGAII